MMFRIIYIIVIVLSLIYSIFLKNSSNDDKIIINTDVNDTIDINLSKWDLDFKKDKNEKHIIILFKSDYNDDID